ncbi:MAG: hypothetical protein K0R87_1463 [Pseudonocardia sp.]|jgi:hypothetical protein|nr:hypothetical protein [Pseudonocardia sp.]
MARRARTASVVVPAVGTAVDAAVAGEAAAATTDVAGRATKRAGRAARKAGAAAERTGEDIRRGRGPLTPARARRMIGVGRVVAPLLAPYALAAAGAARAHWDAYRAGRLGVTPMQLSAYSGRGGALHARIDRIAEALDALERTAEDDTPRRFVEETRPRLADLAVAVRASEQMPAPRRRTAHKAIAGELDRVELALLRRLGVGQPGT